MKKKGLLLLAIFLLIETIFFINLIGRPEYPTAISEQMIWLAETTSIVSAASATAEEKQDDPKTIIVASTSIVSTAETTIAATAA